VSLVDVVIPTCCRRDFTREAVESVLGSTFADFTLTVVEDGSDDFADIAQGIRDPRFRYFRLPQNRGPSAARNAGAAAGSSPYIAFLDSDDLWKIDKLKKQIAFLQEHPTCRWVHTNEIWIKNGTEIKQRKEHAKHGGDFIRRSLERCLIAVSSVVMERSLFESTGGFAESFRVAEDYEYWIRILPENPVCFLAEPLAIKRGGHPGQLSQTPAIDRQRVLALHRLYRNRRNDPEFALLADVTNEMKKKTGYLLAGAQKNAPHRVAEYQNWLNLFRTFRT